MKMLKNETNPKPTGTLGFLPAGGRAHPAGGLSGSTGACRLLSGRPVPASGVRSHAWIGVSLCGARDGRAHSLYSVTCPHKVLALRGTWGPGARKFAVCWDLGHKGCTDRANPNPLASS